MKKCKKHKISAHTKLTKQEMVDRIIHSQRIKKLNNKTLQRMNELSAFKATLVLIEGYIHIHTRFNLYPLDIITIIGQYITLVLTRFDIVHKRYAKCVINGGTMFKRDTYFRKRKKNQDVTMDAVRSQFIVGCSIGYSFGIHKWKIKLIKPKPSDWVGVISNVGLFKKQHLDIFTDKGWSVAYLLLGGRYLRSVNGDYVGWNKKFKDHNDGYLPIWKKGDLVGVELDCDNWRMSMSVNEQKIKTLWIKPYVTYYVAIGSVNNQSQYQLITFD